jgi:hypothetical protein
MPGRAFPNILERCRIGKTQDKTLWYLFKDWYSMIKPTSYSAFPRPTAPHFTGAEVHSPITDKYGTSVQVDASC